LLVVVVVLLLRLLCWRGAYQPCNATNIMVTYSVCN